MMNRKLLKIFIKQKKKNEKMGKFNKKTINIPIDQEKSVDWSQLIADFENSSVEQAIENIMLKVILIFFSIFFN